MTDSQVFCKCESWRLCAEQIFTAQVQLTLNAGVVYTGPIWVYCPWCGKKLQVKK